MVVINNPFSLLLPPPKKKRMVVLNMVEFIQKSGDKFKSADRSVKLQHPEEGQILHRNNEGIWWMGSPDP